MYLCGEDSQTLISAVYMSNMCGQRNVPIVPILWSFTSNSTILSSNGLRNRNFSARQRGLFCHLYCRRLICGAQSMFFTVNLIVWSRYIFGNDGMLCPVERFDLNINTLFEIDNRRLQYHYFWDRRRACCRHLCCAGDGFNGEWLIPCASAPIKRVQNAIPFDGTLFNVISCLIPSDQR